jgi:OOP family OmpA-OmpF porin
VTVIGHTDSTGPDDYNMKLSVRRARAAADYLESLGIDSITVKGMGETQPIASNKTREGRSQNRRIEITTH